MPQKPVDRPIIMVVGPLLDASTGKIPQTAVAWNAAGMGIDLIFEKYDDPAETSGSDDVTPASSADWTHIARGYYEVVIDISLNADTGNGRLAGIATGVLPFHSPTYDVIRQHEFDARVSGTTNARIVADTTMTGRTSQTVFRLTAGSSENDFYLGHRCIIYDAGSIYAVASGTVAGYVGSTKEVTLDSLSSNDPFTTANGDVVIIEAVPLSVTVTSPHARAEMDDSSTKLADIVADTNELQTDNVPGLIAALNDFDSTYDVVSTVTFVATCGTLQGHTAQTGDNYPPVVDIQAQTDKLPTSLTMQLMYDDLITIAAVTASPAPTTTAFACDLTETTNNHYKDLAVGFASGPLQGQVAQVLGYDGGTKVLTVTEMTNAPAVGNVILLLGLVK